MILRVQHTVHVFQVLCLKNNMYTPRKTNMEPENQWLESVFPIWNSLFLGDMFVFRGVNPCQPPKIGPQKTTHQPPLPGLTSDFITVHCSNSTCWGSQSWQPEWSTSIDSIHEIEAERRSGFLECVLFEENKRCSNIGNIWVFPKK